MIWILFAIFFICLLLGVPVAFSLGMSCLGYLIFSDIPLIVIPAKLYSGIDVFVLLSIPGFILAGNLMNHGGLTDRIIQFCNHLLGHIRGGLAVANIGSSMLFAGISGTAVSDASSIGSVMIPAMKKEGYDGAFSCAVTASSSTVGPIIPPSVPMIIAATLTGLSVGKLFLAGAIPGFMLGFGMIAVAIFIARKKKYPKHERSSLAEIFKGFINTFWALMMSFIVLFGIIGGIFTPTEASIIAVLYAAAVGLAYRRINLGKLPAIIIDSMKMSASLMVLVGFANLFGWILIVERVPQWVSEGLLGFSDNKYVILLLINIILIFVGTFMETIAALLVMFPILLKVALTVDVDPVHFAVIAVLNLIIGLTTPPIGICLFVTSSIGKTPIDQVAKANWPFLLLSLIVLTLVTLFPQLSLFLPSLFAE